MDEGLGGVCLWLVEERKRPCKSEHRQQERGVRNERGDEVERMNE